MDSFFTIKNVFKDQKLEPSSSEYTQKWISIINRAEKYQSYPSEE